MEDGRKLCFKDLRPESKKYRMSSIRVKLQQGQNNCSDSRFNLITKKFGLKIVVDVSNVNFALLSMIIKAHCFRPQVVQHIFLPRDIM